MKDDIQPLTPAQAKIARQIANDTPDIHQLSVNNAIRMWRALRDITLCAEMALETMPHGSDRYDLAVAVDAAKEALK